MKRLNITKEQFEKSRYFKDKYGTLEYVSESGKLFKTNKGQVLKFTESSEATCDMCGMEGHEDYFDIVPGYGFICPDCQEQVKKMGGARGEPISSKTMNDELYDEGVKDAIKSGWNKVKQGAKAVGKAIGDTFKGPFRKGDHIVMKGEDGETFKGTIRDFDLSEQTYKVLLGNPVNEGLEEDIQEMPDRVDELESEIESLWEELGHLPDDKYKVIIDLISRYLELERLKPGSLLPLDFKESAENPSKDNKDEPEEEEEPSQVSRDLAEYYSGRRYTGD